MRFAFQCWQRAQACTKGRLLICPLLACAPGGNIERRMPLNPRVLFLHWPVGIVGCRFLSHFDNARRAPRSEHATVLLNIDRRVPLNSKGPARSVSVSIPLQILLLTFFTGMGNFADARGFRAIPFRLLASSSLSSSSWSSSSSSSSWSSSPVGPVLRPARPVGPVVRQAR